MALICASLEFCVVENLYVFILFHKIKIINLSQLGQRLQPYQESYKKDVPVILIRGWQPIPMPQIQPAACFCK